MNAACLMVPLTLENIQKLKLGFKGYFLQRTSVSVCPSLPLIPVLLCGFGELLAKHLFLKTTTKKLNHSSHVKLESIARYSISDPAI